MFLMLPRLIIMSSLGSRDRCLFEDNFSVDEDNFVMVEDNFTVDEDNFAVDDDNFAVGSNGV